MPFTHSMETILDHVVQGDPAAFARLYRHYRTPAFKFCLHLLKDSDEAENMVHDVFIKIWERRNQINPSLNFNAYLFTCLRNGAFDYLKQVEKNALLRQRYLEQMESAQQPETDDQDTRIELLQTAIGSLSKKRKMILLMSVEGGQSYQEIAELLRISKNTVKNQLVKAKQLLRQQIEFAPY